MIKTVIIPGWGSKKILFEGFIKNLTDARYIELPGNRFEDAEQVLEKESAKLNIIGWSLGSLFALKYAIANPDRINSLVLLGSTLKFCGKASYDNGIEEKKLNQMIMLIKKRKEAVMDDFYSTCLDFVNEKDHYISLALKDLPDAAVLLNGLNELKNIDLVEQAELIKSKVLIIHGKYDKITPLKGAEIMNKKIAGSKLLTVDGGHALFLEKPEYTARLIKEFECTVH